MKLNEGLGTTFINDVWENYASERLASTGTYNSYVKMVNNFYKLTGASPVTCSVAAAKSYFNQIKNTTSINTQYTRLAAFKSLRQYAIDKGIVFEPRNIFAFVELDDKPIEYTGNDLPCIDELHGLLNNVKGNVRDELLFNLILKCALTTGEIIRLRRTDFCLSLEEEPILHISGSGAGRNLLLPIDVVEIAGRYFNEYNKATNSVFINKRGGVLTERTLQRIVLDRVSKCVSANILYKPYTADRLRTAGIACMLAGGATNDETCKLAGIKPYWLFRLNHTVEVYRASEKSIL